MEWKIIEKKLKTIIFSLLGLLGMLCLPVFTFPFEPLFEVKPDNIPYYRENEIYSAWNPKGTPEIKTPGLKIFFFGRAEGCISEAKNGVVKIIKPDKKISLLSGLILNERGKVFLPVQDRDLCNIIDKPKEGGSFIYIIEEATNGGVGIFTASGIDEKRIPYFFQSRGEEGVGSGVNKFEKSTAVTWRLEKEKVFPFKEEKSLKILVKSSVESLPQSIVERKLPVQVRQQIEIGFANRECLKEKEDKKILCLNKYVFDFLVKRWGGKPLDKERGCLIFVDKAQGGLPHIACYSKPKGEKILEKRSRLDMVTSCGEGFQQDVFKDKIFCYTISWEQFLNSLQAIASNNLNKSIQTLSEKDLKKLFGEGYNNPNNWYITVVSFQQELHDPYKDVNVFIGGNIKKLTID